MTQQRTVPVAEPSTADAPPGTHQRVGSPRRRTRQAVRLVADGTGRSEVEVQWLLVTTAASVLVASAVAATFGVLRLVDFLTDA